MLFYYIVIETINGVKQSPIIMNETELQHKIDSVTKLNDNKQTIVTEKAG
jgi:hypothetical protein